MAYQTFQVNKTGPSVTVTFNPASAVAWQGGNLSWMGTNNVYGRGSWNGQRFAGGFSRREPVLGPGQLLPVIAGG